VANIAKVITVIGSSPESFAKAAEAAVAEAAKTVRGIHGAHVASMSAVVEDDRITGFEGPEVLDPLPHAHELDRKTELVGDREGHAALRRAVQLRQGHAGHVN